MHFKSRSKPSLIPYIQCILTSLQNKEWKEEKDQDDQWFNNPKNQFPFSISSFQIYKEVELPKNKFIEMSRWKIETRNDDSNLKMPLNERSSLCAETERSSSMSYAHKWHDRKWSCYLFVWVCWQDILMSREMLRYLSWTMMLIYVLFDSYSKPSCVQRDAKVPLANKVRGGSFSSRCEQGHQFMFRLFEYFVNKKVLCPEID